MLDSETSPLTHVTIGAAIEVHKTMGPGFLESVYHETLCLELAERGVTFVSQPKLKLRYKGRLLQATFRPDLVCQDELLLELKAQVCLVPEDEAQVVNYLKATGLRVGLLLNFGTKYLEIRRIVFDAVRATTDVDHPLR